MIFGRDTWCRICHAILSWRDISILCPDNVVRCKACALKYAQKLPAKTEEKEIILKQLNDKEIHVIEENKAGTVIL